MKAVVLVGGYGTRLRPLTFSIPKSLLPVGERPLLQLILERLRECDFEEVVLATGYHEELIRAFCGDGTRFGMRITYVHEEEPLGTAGPLALLNGLVGGEDFLLMNGDVLTGLDFRRLADFRREQSFDLVVASTTHVYQSPFGVLEVADSEVVDIVEKPALEQLISAGLYAVGEGVANFVPSGTFFTMPQLIIALLQAGRRVGAFPVDDVWIGLESIAHFEEAVRQVAELSAPASPASDP